jgi:predicted permease
MAAISERPLAIRLGSVTRHEPSALVSGNFFTTLGVHAALGRTLSPADDAPAVAGAAVISDAFWTTAFGRDSSALGRTIFANDAAYTVVGVLPPDFRGVHLGSSPGVWIPVSSWPSVAPSPSRAAEMTSRNGEWLRMVGRLDEVRTVAQAHAQLVAIAAAASPETTRSALAKSFQPRRLQEAALPASARGGASLFLTVLGAVVFLVLMAACSNIAGLMLARTAGRQRELAVRLALGAGRARLVRFLLVEAALIAGAGAAAALVIHETIRAMLASTTLPGGISGEVLRLPTDLALVGAVGALAVACAIAIGLVPALRATRGDLVASLRGGSTTAGRRQGLLRGALVGMQVAVALILLVGMGLFARALRAGLDVPLGFDTEQVATMLVATGTARLSLEGEQQYLRTVTRTLEELPGVRSASWTTSLPLTSDEDRSTAVVAGYQPRQGERVALEMNVVGPGYHSTLGIPLVAGREFDESDRVGTEPAAVVNEALVARYLPGRDPIGVEITMMGRSFRVIGVIRNVKNHSLDETPVPYIYFSHLQASGTPPLSLVNLVVRTEQPAAKLLPEVVRAVQAARPGIPVFDARTLQSRVSDALAPQLAGSALLGAFSVIALVVSVIGVYAIAAFSVSQRTREFGVRLALGAQPLQIMRLVMTSISLFVLAGIIGGGALALLLSPSLSAFLVGVPPGDPLTFGAAGAILTLVCLVASYLPARRVVRIEPLDALRHD